MYKNRRRNIAPAVYNPSKLREGRRRHFLGRQHTSLQPPTGSSMISIDNNPQSHQEPTREPDSVQVTPGSGNVSCDNFLSNFQNYLLDFLTSCF